MQNTIFQGEIPTGSSIGEIDGTGFGEISIPGEVPTGGYYGDTSGPGYYGETNGPG